MSIFSIHMLALAGIEIVVGLTMIGTLLAIVILIIGDSKETTATEPQTAISANTLEETEAALKDPSKLTVDEIQQLMERRKEEKERRKMLVAMAEPGISEKVEKSEEAKDAPKVPEKETDKPVMAILQKPESNNKPTEGEELERQIVEKRLQRIADKQANQKKDELGELPAFPTPPKIGGEKSDLPPIPKPFLHELPQPGGEKPALPPMSGSESGQDEPDLQTRDKKRDS